MRKSREKRRAKFLLQGSPAFPTSFCSSWCTPAALIDGDRQVATSQRCQPLFLGCCVPGAILLFFCQISAQTFPRPCASPQQIEVSAHTSTQNSPHTAFQLRTNFRSPARLGKSHYRQEGIVERGRKFPTLALVPQNNQAGPQGRVLLVLRVRPGQTFLNPFPKSLPY